MLQLRTLGSLATDAVALSLAFNSMATHLQHGLAQGGNRSVLLTLCEIKPDPGQSRQLLQAASRD